MLVALVIMWAAFLIPSWRGSRTDDKSMKDFERNMDMLAETESQGRWIVTPRKGTTFVGRRARAQARARERRRRVLVVLIESLALTALIGLVPPLRAMWYATAILLVLLGGYVWALLTMKMRSAEARGPAATSRSGGGGPGHRTLPSGTPALRRGRLEPHGSPVVQRPPGARRRPREHRRQARRRGRRGARLSSARWI